MTKELKTKRNNSSVATFLNAIESDKKRKDSKTIVALMKEITGCKPEMWGESIVGFDTFVYTTSDGKPHTWMALGFSPRKTTLTIYIMPGYQDFGPLLGKLGPHKKGKSCLYIRTLEDIDLPILKKIITKGYKDLKKKYK